MPTADFPQKVRLNYGTYKKIQGFPESVPKGFAFNAAITLVAFIMTVIAMVALPNGHFSVGAQLAIVACMTGGTFCYGWLSDLWSAHARAEAILASNMTQAHVEIILEDPRIKHLISLIRFDHELDEAITSGTGRMSGRNGMSVEEGREILAGLTDNLERTFKNDGELGAMRIV
jgi:hypothetical protein